MKNWFSQNYRTLIITAFLIPIITVAIVSISHVTKWYGISNPMSWAIYLSIGIEIATMSALAAISANMGKKVYFPFLIVTLIQFIGNIFFAYSYIDINGKSFKDWIDLVSPFTELLGIDPLDLVGNKRFLAFFAGGMLPIISLSFLHMLVKFTEEDRLNQNLKVEKKTNEDTELEEIGLSQDEINNFKDFFLAEIKKDSSLVEAFKSKSASVYASINFHKELLNRKKKNDTPKSKSIITYPLSEIANKCKSFFPRYCFLIN
jgi:hypothetical protein